MHDLVAYSTGSRIELNGSNAFPPIRKKRAIIETSGFWFGGVSA